MQTVISSDGIKNTIKALDEYYATLSEDGCFFAIITTEYDKKGNVSADLFDVINHAVEKGYKYINTIVYPTTNIQHVTIPDNVQYVIWLCKNKQKMKFNKDPIREKHIWKDVEWGKRAKNYNSKGKDPGNVWIPTEDDGKANITNHFVLSEEDVIKKIKEMTMCGDDYLLVGNKKKPADKHHASNASQSPKCVVSGKVIFSSSEAMNRVEDGSVRVVITSPPYWNLKDYYKDGQIGQESYDKYLLRINTVWNECYKKLSKDGSLWININIRNQKGNVILIPYDIIQQCKRIGLYYKGIIIWHKSSGIPTGDKNLVDRHEYVLIFAKDEQYSLDLDVFDSFRDYKNEDINGMAFWNINRKAGSVGKKYIHPAIYPNDLVGRIIKVTSDEGDLILDPFLGSGTSLIAAMQNKRNFIGYEYNGGFKELMISRCVLELGNIDRISFE